MGSFHKWCIVPLLQTQRLELVIASICHHINWQKSKLLADSTVPQQDKSVNLIYRTIELKSNQCKKNTHFFIKGRHKNKNLSDSQA